MGFPSQYFRAGSGAVIINDRGYVLALERTDIPGAWQMPQGGLDADEEPLQAAYREVAEETGIMQNNLELLDSYPEPLAYELPLNARRKKTGRGQALYWFLFRFTGNENLINAEPGGEFSTWQWMSFQDLLETTVYFRKPVYQKLYDRFSVYLNKH
jgi:putative (di)nucleoside polyphosphate hydrolase